MNDVVSLPPESRVRLTPASRIVRRSAKPPKPGRNLLLVILLLCLGAGLGYWWYRPVVVTVVNPTRGNAIDAVYATGIVEAIDTARIGTTVAGRIVSLAVDEGDNIRIGQILAQLDDRQARDRLADAATRLVLADQELTRDKILQSAGNRSLQAVQQAERELSSAQAMLALSQQQLQEYQLRSPLDGMVMKRNVHVGETLGENAVLYEIGSTHHLRVAADVDERDIAHVMLGEKVAISADAYPGEAFPAAVTRIRPQADTATRTYRVEADLPDDTKLLIGMTVDVNIVISERGDALLLPASAVRYGQSLGGQTGAASVMQVIDGRARSVPVKVGAAGAEKVEIVSGLSIDDAVIDPLSVQITDGIRVQAQP